MLWLQSVTMSAAVVLGQTSIIMQTIHSTFLMTLPFWCFIQVKLADGVKSHVFTSVVSYPIHGHLILAAGYSLAQHRQRRCVGVLLTFSPMFCTVRRLNATLPILASV